MRTSKENIWHFVCSSCNGWFSIATMDEWKPKKLYCPHCGEQHTSFVYDKWKVIFHAKKNGKIEHEIIYE